MSSKNLSTAVKKRFQTQLKKEENVKNAYIKIYSEKNNLDINFIKTSLDNFPKDSQQPHYMESCGKMFTSTIVSKMYENSKISFDDKITKYLSSKITDKLHIYKDKDYSKDIKIKHLLNHKTGFYDISSPLMQQIIDGNMADLNPEKSIDWLKKHTSPSFPPGKRFKYSEANYLLLGLIIESITDMPYHEVLKECIFKPLDMNQSSMLHYSEPIEPYELPIANFYYKETNLKELEQYGKLDYASGGLVTTADDMIKFLKALTSGKFIKKETFDIMLKNSERFSYGIDYGYGIKRFKTFPIVMPKKYNMIGHVGATGSFAFYHPKLDTYLVGTFNDFSYQKNTIPYVLGNTSKIYQACTGKV